VTPHPSADQASGHAWKSAGVALVAKTLAELAYEELLVPLETGPGHYRVDLSAQHRYEFTAGRGGFGTWRVDPGSVTRNGVTAVDPVQLVLDGREQLGLDGPTAAEVVRELTATQAADTRIISTGARSSELADLDYAQLEQHLTGHPVLVLNKGRLGFTAQDLELFAPESHGELRLRWYAAHRSVASYHAAPGLDERILLEQELGPETVAAFTEELRRRGCRPKEYVWLPVHPYQDDNVVRTLFARQLAERLLVPLGEGPVSYRPLQSVRTLAAPGHRDVKTPLLMRNTLVWRGLGTAATAAAADISDWLAGLRAGDPELRDTGLGFLGEVAAVVVRHDALDRLPDAPYRYGELLGVIWREGVTSQLEPDQRARSLAALLHVDGEGHALVAELVNRSGLGAREWLRRLFDAVFPGLLHCLTRHGVAFCPHGENTVVVYDAKDVPTRVLVKDFAEDVNLLPGRHYPGLSGRADSVLVRWPAEELAHSIISAVLAGHFRFFAAVVETALDVEEAEFWSLVRDSLLSWRDRNPHLADAFDDLGLLSPEVERVALNREHLTGGGFHDRSERDAAPDVVHGHVPNPLAHSGVHVGARR
jgi:siderophore synthetase component